MFTVFALYLDEIFLFLFSTTQFKCMVLYKRSDDIIEIQASDFLIKKALSFPHIKKQKRIGIGIGIGIGGIKKGTSEK